MERRDARLTEAGAMLMIGDGVLGVLQPASHCRVWRGGASRWGAAIDWFAAHPQLVRAIGAAELAAGIWLARRQYRALAAGENVPALESTTAA
jgi:hypothetical protein